MQSKKRKNDFLIIFLSVFSATSSNTRENSRHKFAHLIGRHRRTLCEQS